MMHKNKLSTFYRPCDDTEVQLSPLMDLMCLTKTDTEITVRNSGLVEAMEIIKAQAQSCLLKSASKSIGFTTAHKAAKNGFAPRYLVTNSFTLTDGL